MAEKQTMLINEKKLSMMNPEHRKLLEQEMVNFLFEGKDVHIEGYTPPENNNAQLLPGGAALARAYGYVGRVSSATRQQQPQSKHNTHSRNDEKLLALALVAPLLVSCSSKKAMNTTKHGSRTPTVLTF